MLICPPGKVCGMAGGNWGLGLDAVDRGLSLTLGVVWKLKIIEEFS
jgi:hypothetical protein